MQNLRRVAELEKEFAQLRANWERSPWTIFDHKETMQIFEMDQATFEHLNTITEETWSPIKQANVAFESRPRLMIPAESDAHVKATGIM